jgi:hypothetical protein
MPLELRRKYYNSQLFVHSQGDLRHNNHRNSQGPNVELLRACLGLATYPKRGFSKRLQVQRFYINDPTSIRYRLQPDFIDTMHDTCLLFSRNIHHVKCEKFARDLGKANIQMYFHLFSCSPIESAKDIVVSLPYMILPRPLSTINSGCTTTSL